MPGFKDIEVNGKVIRINRLTVEAESQLWFDELAPLLAPLAGDLLNGLAPMFTGRGFNPAAMKLDFGDILRQLTKELGWVKVKALAEKLLANSQHDGKHLWPQVNAVLSSTMDLCKVLYAALEFFYADFWKALGSAPSLVLRAIPGKTPNSEGSTDTVTSTSNPSTTS